MNMKILTQSGYFTSPLEVAEHLSRRVDTDDWRAAHKDRTIKRITVMYSDHTEIHERPVVEKDFEPLPVLRDDWQLEVAPASGNDMAESERASAIRQVLR